MVIYVACALAFMRIALPIQSKGGLLTLSLALIAAALVALWRAPRRLKTVSGIWVVHGAVHAGDEATVGALVTATAGAPPFTLEAFNPTTRRFDAVVRLKHITAAPVKPSWTVRFPKRGRVRMPPLVARCDQPFGVLSAARPIGEPIEVVVLPTLGTVKKALHARLRSWLDLHATTTADAGDDELANLRDYRPGDAPHSIHWRASARQRTLLVAERHALGCRRLALVVDTAAAANDSRMLEKLICAAATLVDDLTTRGWSLTLYGAFAPLGVHGTRERLLEALALATVDRRSVSDFVPSGVPAVVLCLGEAPQIASHPRPLILPLSEIHELVHLPGRMR
ncbi:MAG: DUF58 domain-containing protein [Planctomycetes bacterium]|nr:DUF58 domain-containing protein [Planctomycetota bacterium]